MTKADFIFRIYKKQDCEALAHLWKKSRILKDRDIECSLTSYIRWKYDFAHRNMKNIICLCLQGERALASCGALARQVLIEGRKASAFFGVDSLVDPELRKKKEGRFLFFRVYRKALLGEFRKGRKGLVNCCFPNKKVRGLYLRTGWVDTNIIAHMVKRISKDHGRGIKTNISFERIDRFNKRMLSFIKNIESKFSFIITRNSTYLNWRYCDCPSKKYIIYIAKKGAAVKGYMVLRIEPKGGYIVELLADPDDAGLIKCMILKAEEFFKIRNIYDISVLCGNKRMNNIFLNSGYATKRKVDFFLFSKNKQMLDELLKNKDNMFVMAGDTDGDTE